MQHLRIGVQTFAAGCEQIISFSLQEPLTPEEHLVVAYYMSELDKIILQPQHSPKTVPDWRSADSV